MSSSSEPSPERRGVRRAARLLTPGRIAGAAVVIFLVSGRCNRPMTADDAAPELTEPTESAVPNARDAATPPTTVDGPAAAPTEAALPAGAPDAEEGAAGGVELDLGALEPASQELVVGEENLLAEDAHFRVSTRAWELAGRRGIAWHVATPLPLDGVSARVRAAESPVAFDTLTPDAGAGDAGDAPAAWAAINGGFYYPSGAPMGWVRSEGNDANPHARGGGSGVFQVVNGQPQVVHQSEHEEHASDAVQSIDRIIDQGASLMRSLDGRRAARSAVVITPTHLELVVVADALSVTGPLRDARLRLSSHLGMSLGGFAAYLVESTQASAALNLDGAVSTHLAARVGGVSIRVQGEDGTPNAIVLSADE